MNPIHVTRLFSLKRGKCQWFSDAGLCHARHVDRKRQKSISSFCFSSQALIKSNYHFFPPTTTWIRISAIPIVMREFCAIKFIPRLNGKKKQKQQQQHIMSGSVHIRIHSAVEMCNKYIWIANKCISILINYYSFYIKFYYIQLNIAYKYCN